MAITQSKIRFDRTGHRYVESGLITWSTTDTTGTLKTGLKVIREAVFTNATATPAADSTHITQAADADGNLVVSGGGVTVVRIGGTLSGLTQLYKLAGE